jgi:hypothetical protein
MDVLYPDVRGARPTIADRLSATYSRRLTRAATGSYNAAAALWDITSLEAPPTRVLHPKALLAALAGPLLPETSEPPLQPSERQILERLRKASEGTVASDESP